MNFTILVNAAPSQQGAMTAYQFTKALLAKGHKITSLFFYRDGILNGNAFVSLPSDEFNLVTAWQELAKEHQLELMVCVAAALRRGVLDDTEAEYYAKPAGNVAPGFKLTGLGQLLEAIIHADRFIAFN